jgi:uncharacterized protein YpmS
MKNKWKNLFFLLAFMNVMVVILILFYSLSPTEPTKIENEDSKMRNIPLHVQTNKRDLNQLINHYINDQQNGPIYYGVVLDEFVILSGALTIFNQKTEMKITFEPEVLENGELLLHYKSMNLGRLRLPASLVLKYVNEQYQFPDWIMIEPNEEYVYLRLQKMKLGNGLIVETEEFDLHNDRFRFRLLVPTEKGASA